MKLNTAFTENAADWMKGSADKVLDLMPQQCVHLPNWGADPTLLECDDLSLQVEDDLRDDNENDRRSKSLLDVDPSFDSNERKDPPNDASSMAAIRGSFHEDDALPTKKKDTESPPSSRPKNLPMGRFRKKTSVSPMRYPTPENAVVVSDKRSTLSSFDAAARSNASWQLKMAALQAMKQQSRVTKTHLNDVAAAVEPESEVKEERQEAPLTNQEPEIQKKSGLANQSRKKDKKAKSESVVEKRPNPSPSHEEKPRSIMKSTNSARKDEKVSFHQEHPSKEASEAKEVVQKETPVEVQEEKKEKNNDYGSISSLEDPLEEEGVITNLSQLGSLKNPDYHPVGEPKVIRQNPQKKTKKKPILGFLKRRKRNDKETMGRTFK